MSTEWKQESVKYWQEVGPVVVYDSNGNMVMGRIEDLTIQFVIVRDILGMRHWISPDAIVRITEVGTKIEEEIKKTVLGDKAE